jgi:hypothetical protein
MLASTMASERPRKPPGGVADEVAKMLSFPRGSAGFNR